MQNELNQLVEAAEQAISAAADLKSLDDIRVTYLGKKGSITERMKLLGKLPKEDKPAAGQAINVAKQAVQKSLEARKETLNNAELEAKLSSETIDVTLPGRGQQAGGLHPVTRTMERIEELVAKKRQVASWYAELLSDIKDITLPVEKSYAKNTYWMYSILIDSKSETERDAFMEYLSKNGIDTRPFFYLMTDMMPYKKYKSDDLTIAKRIAAQGVNLPSSTLLEYEHIEQIVKEIRLYGE